MIIINDFKKILSDIKQLYTDLEDELGKDALILKLNIWLLFFFMLMIEPATYELHEERHYFVVSLIIWFLMIALGVLLV